jgi:hypothetical protein
MLYVTATVCNEDQQKTQQIASLSLIQLPLKFRSKKKFRAFCESFVCGVSLLQVRYLQTQYVLRLSFIPPAYQCNIIINNKYTRPITIL